MIELTGDQTNCKIFIDQVDEPSISQVYDFLNHPAFKGCKTRFMPDIHAGAGAVIGTTVELSDKVIPNVIGVDIGCGMLSCKLGRKDIDFSSLDHFIRHNIPSGFSINSCSQLKDQELRTNTIDVCKRIGITTDRAIKSVGSLGGGNHFIEIGRDEERNLWLTIHSGSRNFGLQIAKHHQETAKKIMEGDIKFKKGMEYLSGKSAREYFYDMSVAQSYAMKNREIMSQKILEFLGCEPLEIVISVHNYIDFSDRIIRKGAISAHKDQLVVIPWNMRDGLIIGRGKGNPDWNFSAPHGAGRSMSRSKAKAQLNLGDFKSSMKGIFTSCVNKTTIDESPMAYKDHSLIEKYLSETVDIIHRVKPEYNFKAN